MATKNDRSKYYSRLVVYKGRKYSLAFAIGIVFSIFSVLIFENLLAERGWTVLIVPVLILGLLFVLHPATEEWDYEPWQSSPQQYERHFRD